MHRPHMHLQMIASRKRSLLAAAPFVGARERLLLGVAVLVPCQVVCPSRGEVAPGKEADVGGLAVAWGGGAGGGLLVSAVQGVCVLS